MVLASKGAVYARVLVLTTRDTWFATQADAALEAVGIAARWSENFGIMDLEVADEDVERVSAVLSEQMGEELRKRGTPRLKVSSSPLILQPAFAGALCGAVVLLLVHWFVHASSGCDSPDLRGSAAIGRVCRGFEDWTMRGTMVPDAVRAGELYRLVTAATLHADANHVLHNAGFLVLLGWAASERVGVGVALFGWLVTAIAGFLVSMVYDPRAWSIGASGGLFGLLGIAVGHALRTGSGREVWYRHRMR
ncbi:MAG: rhomboid family intramembrane serine protease, partial [Clostridia bacterium]|nr:rhomboid family intramembrane serine protease [Deltaproteobacteria bacterium]